MTNRKHAERVLDRKPIFTGQPAEPPSNRETTTKLGVHHGL
jgi:hypothetical protein